MLLSSCGQMFNSKPSAASELSYLVIETNNERVLFAQNANERKNIGMLANVATAVVIADWIQARNISLDTMLTVPVQACQWPDTNLLHLSPGDKISLRDALHSALMWDDSAATTTMAWECGKSLHPADPEGAFLLQLETLASQTLGMKQAHFRGLSGAVKSSASARDMVLLGTYAIEKPLIQAICSKYSYTATITARNGSVRHVQINNTNRLLGAQGVDGLRAAASGSAGYCLMASARRGSYKAANPAHAENKQATYAQRLLVVILGMPNANHRDNKAAALLRDGWKSWEIWQKTSDMTDQSKFIRLPKH